VLHELAGYGWAAARKDLLLLLLLPQPQRPAASMWHAPV
jgi:hypothetical protein